MKFSEFAQYLEKLEATSSRLTLIEILSELFKKIASNATAAPYSEIEQAVYLVQGRIAPFFEPTEIGMAEKSVASSIAIAYGSSKEKILKLNSKLGDMGLAAYELARNSIRQESGGRNSKLTVGDVFEVLTQAAKTSGEGTVEKRQKLLSGLLGKVDATSAKHLVRVPLGNT